MTKDKLDQLTFEIIGSAIEVHKVLGPDLLESIYGKCLAKEFEMRKIQYSTELNIPLIYKNYNLDTNLRCDFFIENSIVLEIKSVLEMSPIFEAQILSYMNLLNAPKGILINFNSKNIFHEGQKTCVNFLYRDLTNY